MMVRDRVAKHAEEPRLEALPVADRVEPFRRLQEGLLQEVFRVSPRADPLSCECQKGGSLVGEQHEELPRERT